MGYGLGLGLWVMGYGLWVMGYGLWVMGYGLWVKVKVKVRVRIRVRVGDVDSTFVSQKLHLLLECLVCYARDTFAS